MWPSEKAAVEFDLPSSCSAFCWPQPLYLTYVRPVELSSNPRQKARRVTLCQSISRVRCERPRKCIGLIVELTQR